jgi:glycosyltransferase involved in cell wall biosynthesis
MSCNRSADIIDIVVVPRDRFSMFPRCLEAVYLHTHVPFRLVVVAGAADRRTEGYLRELEARECNVSVVLESGHLTQAEARNLGLRWAKGRHCVVLENDTVVHDNWLAPMLECMREERAAAVMPLILWYRGIHAAGCTFQVRDLAGRDELSHKILYSDIRRKRIDYPECHCILFDRTQVTGDQFFGDVEPFDVDLGLTLQELELSAFLEPSSVATYSAPPPLEVRDISLYKFRWDAPSWKARNVSFQQKWGVKYDAASKVASYRRQALKLGLANWYENRWTVALANLSFSATNALLSMMKRRSYPAEG